MDNWQPIETAPIERCAALLYFANRPVTDIDGTVVTETARTKFPLRAACWQHSLAVWDGEAWIDADTGHDVIEEWTHPEEHPTHWLPLPPSPEKTA